MRAFTIVSALIAVAVSGVTANPGESVANIFARQAGNFIPDIPTECQAKCATVQTITSCGTDLACMCTTKMGQGIVDCGNCGIEYYKDNTQIQTYKQQFQAAVNSYADACTQAGHPIGPFAIGGSTSSGGSSGGSGSSGSSTTSGSTTTPTGSTSNANTSSSANGAMTFNAAAGTSALAALAVVMASVF